MRIKKGSALVLATMLFSAAEPRFVTVAAAGDNAPARHKGYLVWRDYLPPNFSVESSTGDVSDAIRVVQEMGKLSGDTAGAAARAESLKESLERCASAAGLPRTELIERKKYALLIPSSAKNKSCTSRTLDKKGNKLALRLLQASTKTTGVMVEVLGEDKGEELKVNEMHELP